MRLQDLWSIPSQQTMVSVIHQTILIRYILLFYLKFRSSHSLNVFANMAQRTTDVEQHSVFRFLISNSVFGLLISLSQSTSIATTYGSKMLASLILTRAAGLHPQTRNWVASDWDRSWVKALLDANPGNCGMSLEQKVLWQGLITESIADLRHRKQFTSILGGLPRRTKIVPRHRGRGR